ncbi:MAG: nitronate monooxygenase [Gemmatimonadota bacterium]|nr:nitronate monooxygenase [Gemmatimonadota bacterium]
MTWTNEYPRIIQGGMGIGVSGWRLARAVSRLGQLGVVSGTSIDTVMIRRLQDGDEGDHVRRAMDAFPISGVSDDLLRRYYRPAGERGDTPYALLPMFRRKVSLERQRITMMANFVEVWLAKEGHDGVVGINLLTKVQMPNLQSLYGAMLAGVDYVLMGAGIPREIPGALDALAEHRVARLKLDVEGPADAAMDEIVFDPRDHLGCERPPLGRPRFIPIVSASSLATNLARKASGRVDGFIVEGPTAGGHNAPPRGEPRFSPDGEPLYGERDVVDLEKIKQLGLPFWLAGSAGTPEGLRAALAVGAAGVQVGTLFAYSDESGFAPELKIRVLAGIGAGTVRVRTDPRASPTGYPFKVVHVEGLQNQDDARERNCDLGYLRTAYRTPTGTIGYRCAAEPVEDFVAKGGDIADTVGRRCLCNGLTANIGQPQHRTGGNELPLLTSGDDLVSLSAFARGRSRYSAEDVVNYLCAASLAGA